MAIAAQEPLLARAERACDGLAARYEPLTRLAAQLGVRRAYVGAAVVTAGLLFVFVFVGAHLFSNLVGFGWPAYSTFKLLESLGAARDEGLVTHWLTYWICFAGFSLIEIFADVLVSWFPLYWTAKIAFLLWLQSTTTRGAEFVYQRFLRPALMSHLGDIDALVARAGAVANAAGAGAGAAAVAGAAALAANAALAEGGLAGGGKVE